MFSLNFVILHPLRLRSLLQLLLALPLGYHPDYPDYISAHKGQSPRLLIYQLQAEAGGERGFAFFNRPLRSQSRHLSIMDNFHANERT